VIEKIKDKLSGNKDDQDELGDEDNPQLNSNN